MGSDQTERDSIRYEGAQSRLCLGWVGWDQKGMGPALGRVQSLHLSSPLQGLPHWFPSACQPGVRTGSERLASEQGCSWRWPGTSGSGGDMLEMWGLRKVT